MKVFLSKIANTIRDIDTKVELFANAYNESTSLNNSNNTMDYLR